MNKDTIKGVHCAQFALPVTKDTLICWKLYSLGLALKVIIYTPFSVDSESSLAVPEPLYIWARDNVSLLVTVRCTIWMMETRDKNQLKTVHLLSASVSCTQRILQSICFFSITTKEIHYSSSLVAGQIILQGTLHCSPCILQ